MGPWVELSGYLAAGLVFAAFFMKTAINIRMVAIASNVAFILYALMAHATPILVLHGLLLPLNVLRLHEMRTLTRNVRRAASSDLKIDWMRPYMARRIVGSGETVFRKGDAATEMFVVESGEFRLLDLGVVLQPGDVVGELGILNPEMTRTDTLACAADGCLLAITYEDWRVLYFQNPEFGFYFLRLASARLFSNLARAERDLGQARAEVSRLRTTAITPAPGVAHTGVPREAIARDAM